MEAGQCNLRHLGLLFAIGRGGRAGEWNHGAAGLASVVGYLVTDQGC